MLNVHFYEAKVLEMVRVSYLLANRCCVLSEVSSEPEEDDALAGGVAFAAYDDLVARAQGAGGRPGAARAHRATRPRADSRAARGRLFARRPGLSAVPSETDAAAPV